MKALSGKAENQNQRYQHGCNGPMMIQYDIATAGATSAASRRGSAVVVVATRASNGIGNTIHGTTTSTSASAETTRFVGGRSSSSHGITLRGTALAIICLIPSTRCAKIIDPSRNHLTPPAVAACFPRYDSTSALSVTIVRATLFVIFLVPTTRVACCIHPISNKLTSWLGIASSSAASFAVAACLPCCLAGTIRKMAIVWTTRSIICLIPPTRITSLVHPSRNNLTTRAIIRSTTLTMAARFPSRFTSGSNQAPTFGTPCRIIGLIPTTAVPVVVFPSRNELAARTTPSSATATSNIFTREVVIRIQEATNIGVIDTPACASNMCNPVHHAADTSIDSWDSGSITTFPPRDDSNLGMEVSLFDHNRTTRVSLTTIFTYASGAKHDLVHNQPLIRTVTSIGADGRYFSF
mmetsp:Transcript_39185/g.94753  ORF Transcript_39185/g.94753 Transcript_39185/m.94753 type:complete len:409 (+) Transcript_39185:103-1329(+)